VLAQEGTIVKSGGAIAVTTTQMQLSSVTGRAVNGVPGLHQVERLLARLLQGMVGGPSSRALAAGRNTIPFWIRSTCGTPIETTTILECCALFLDIREFQVMNAEHQSAFLRSSSGAMMIQGALPSLGLWLEIDRIVYLP
jgi:hypothetical protein